MTRSYCRGVSPVIVAGCFCMFRPGFASVHSGGACCSACPVARGAARGFGCAVFMVRCGVLAVVVFSSRLAVAVAGCSVSVGFRGCPPVFRRGRRDGAAFAHGSTNCQEHSTRLAICTPVNFAFSQVKIARQTKLSHGSHRARRCVSSNKARAARFAWAGRAASYGGAAFGGLWVLCARGASCVGQTSPAKPRFWRFPSFCPVRRQIPRKQGKQGIAGKIARSGLCSFSCGLCVVCSRSRSLSERRGTMDKGHPDTHGGRWETRSVNIYV